MTHNKTDTTGLRRVLKTTLTIFQLSAPKLGIGWMFALLTANFNRITISDLGVPAVAITTMIGLYHFLSPFQVFFGRLSDQLAPFGFRRSPYLIFGTLLCSVVFPFLPYAALGMGEGALGSFISGYLLLIVFGAGCAMSGNAHYALIAESTTEKERGITVSVVWITMIASLIIAGAIMKKMMPIYTPESMHELYNITPLIAIISILPVLGLEKKQVRTDSGLNINSATAENVTENPIRETVQAARTIFQKSPLVKQFFMFILFSTIGIFLQDTILEVYGAEVLHMSVKETASFQQIWGTGVLCAMLIMGIATAITPLNRMKIALVGNVGTSLGLLILAFTALTADRTLLYPALLVMGISTGLHTLGAVTTMMDISTPESRATYMGLWGFAMSIGSGLSGILAGGLVSGIIETNLLSSGHGYAIIFMLESILMMIGVLVMRGANLQSFHTLKREELVLAMEE
jgi:MFS transporter, BCD family, chlorophyll transporter